MYRCPPRIRLRVRGIKANETNTGAHMGAWIKKKQNNNNNNKKDRRKRNSPNRLMVNWCLGLQLRFTGSLGQGRMERIKFRLLSTLNAPLKVAPGDPQFSQLHSKCKNKSHCRWIILCSFRTSNKAISKNFCMILLKQLTLPSLPVLSRHPLLCGQELKSKAVL